MERYVILITDSLQGQKEFLGHLIEEVGKEVFSNGYSEPVTFVRVISPGQPQQEIHSTWLPMRSLSLSDIELSTPETTLQQGETNSELTLSTKLHDVADTLPVQGCCVSVIVSLSINWIQNADPDVHVSLYAVLKRLRLWHNAVIRFIIPEVDRQSNPLLPFTNYLYAEVLGSVKQFNLLSHSILWAGQIVVLDSRRSVLQCFKDMVFDLKTSLEGCEDIGQSFDKWVKTEPNKTGLQYLHTRNLPGLSLNWGCEIVEEVDLVTLPSFILSPCRLLLRPINLNCESEFIEHVHNNPEVGYVLRVGYFRREEMKTCGEGLRSTTHWKETISANINSINDLFDGGHDFNGYLHLLVTSDRSREDLSSNNQNLSCTAYVLRSPQEINGGTLEFIDKHSLNGKSLMSNENEEEFKSVINNIPLCDWSDLERTQALIVQTQREVLQTWVEERLKRGEPVLMNETELSTLLRTVHRDVLTSIHRSEQTVNMVKPRYKSSIQKGDLTKADDWPEKEVLRTLESKSRKLSRFVSSESLLQSSPIQPSEGGEKSVDVCNFLKLFQADGSAAQNTLSVLQGKEHCILFKKMSSFDDRETKWPESKEVRYHDIYYNCGRKCEKFEDECCKLRQRYVTCETRSTVSSSTSGVLDHACTTLKTRANKKLRHSPPVRRSPRKHAPASISLSRMTTGSQRKRSCPDDELEYNPRTEPLCELTSQTKVKLPVTRRLTETAGTGPAKEDVPPKRSSRVNDDKSGKFSRSESTSDQSTKKSRSDRHKRRLKEIVETVLKGKGVRSDNPLYEACSSKLFMVTKIYAMELPTSRNLVVEMTKIAEGQVQQVIDLELMKRESSN